MVVLTILSYSYCICQSFNHQVFVNSKGERFVSMDAGITWSREKDKKQHPVGFEMQYFQNSKGTVFISTDYGVTWTKKNDNLQGTDDQADTIAPLLIVSPNPASWQEGITLTFMSPVKKDKATVQIYDRQSNEILLEIIQDISEGFNSKSLNLTSDFVTGAYYILMQIDNEIKMVYTANFIIQ